MSYMSWFAVSHDIIDDSKLKVISIKAGVSKPIVLAVWLFILREASASKSRGIIHHLNLDEAEAATDVPSEQIDKIVALMVERNMLDAESKDNTTIGIQYDSVHVCNFLKWQKLSETETKRLGDRERQRTARKQKKPVMDHKTSQQKSDPSQTITTYHTLSQNNCDILQSVTDGHEKSPNNTNNTNMTDEQTPPLTPPGGQMGDLPSSFGNNSLEGRRDTPDPFAVELAAWEKSKPEFLAVSDTLIAVMSYNAEFPKNIKARLEYARQSFEFFTSKKVTAQRQKEVLEELFSENAPTSAKLYRPHLSDIKSLAVKWVVITNALALPEQSASPPVPLHRLPANPAAFEKDVEESRRQRKEYLARVGGINHDG